MSDKVCPHCNRPLVEIDHYGEVLVGCIDCNRWGHPGDDKFIMELMDSDLEALRGNQRRGRLIRLRWDRSWRQLRSAAPRPGRLQLVNSTPAFFANCRSPRDIAGLASSRKPSSTDRACTVHSPG
jgi:hypothetical protein